MLIYHICLMYNISMVITELNLDGLESFSVSRGTRRNLSSTILRVQLETLAKQGIGALKASRMVGCHKDTAYAIYRESNFRQRVLGKVESVLGEADASFASAQKSLHAQLQEESLVAFGVLKELLSDPDVSDTNRIKIAVDMMNRNPEVQAGHTVNYQKIDPAQLARAASVAKELENDNVVAINGD